jgi:meiotic recombination protein REC8, fungi type
MDIDDFQPILGDDLDLLQDLDFGEEVPAAQPEQPSTLSSDQIEYSETAEAPMKPRKKRTLEMDPTQEMRNSELSRMNTEYAVNMQHQAAQRSLQKIATQAKKNALFWVWSLGIGGVGQGIGVDHIRDPLHAFGGDELYLALTGEGNIARKRKVSPVDDASTDSETRRKRAREEDADQVGRGDDLIEDEGAVQFDDDVKLLILHS